MAGRRPAPQPKPTPHADPRPLVPGYHSGAGYSPDGVEPISPVSSPSLAHDKGLSKPLEELEKSHLEGELRHKQPGDTRERSGGETEAHLPAVLGP